jgi:nucleotide-binding universal stress UspA family protein
LFIGVGIFYAQKSIQKFLNPDSSDGTDPKEVVLMFQRILVPLDGSKRAEKILPYVEDMAGRYKSKVIFVQVIESKAIVGAEGAYVTLSDGDFDQLKKGAETYLNGIQGEFREKKIEAKTSVLYGPVVDAVINIAARENADLIALASHGRGGLSRVFYGSVAAGALHRVDRPLFIIRSRRAD